MRMESGMFQELLLGNAPRITVTRQWHDSNMRIPWHENLKDSPNNSRLSYDCRTTITRPTCDKPTTLQLQFFVSVLYPSWNHHGHVVADVTTRNNFLTFCTTVPRQPFYWSSTPKLYDLLWNGSDRYDIRKTRLRPLNSISESIPSSDITPSIWLSMHLSSLNQKMHTPYLTTYSGLKLKKNFAILIFLYLKKNHISKSSIYTRPLLKRLKTCLVVLTTILILKLSDHDSIWLVFFRPQQRNLDIKLRQIFF